ncbi:MAG: phosphopentomutase [Planctomycetes bacterium]|nr:phosphopentomutase [Planctomycetota bacterium]
MSPARFRRVAVVVLDSVGVGGAPDAALFGDERADTLGHIHETVGLDVPNLVRLGLGRLVGFSGEAAPVGAWGRMRERSAGKDTMTGHFEIAGVISASAYPTYPEGFPPDLIARYAKKIGRGILGNKPASGTEILDELGPEHVETGKPIVYTSADSVFQIAANVEVVPLEELYRWCEAARELLAPPHAVARVIARPFAGRPGAFERTKDRKDYALPPPGPTILDHLAAAGYETVAVGKIGDIFSERGITRSIHAKGNEACTGATLDALASSFEGMIFTNLVDFDMLYGHRRDARGYRDCLEAFDRRLPELLAACREDDLLVVTADHGNDPTYRGTDHTREEVPLLVYHRRIRPRDLGTRSTFADVAATVDEVFGLGKVACGESFLPLV